MERNNIENSNKKNRWWPLWQLSGVLSLLLFIIFIFYVIACEFGIECDTGSGLGWTIVNNFPALSIFFGIIWLILSRVNKKIILWSIFRTILYIILIYIFVPLLINNNYIHYNHSCGFADSFSCERIAKEWAVFSYSIGLFTISSLDLLISGIIVFYKNIKKS